MAKVESGKGSKTSERKPPKKKEGSSAPQAMDQGSEESKFKPRMRETYLQKVVPALMKEFGYKNIMQVPKLERIVLNVGMGEAIQNVKLLESAARMSSGNPNALPTSLNALFGRSEMTTAVSAARSRPLAPWRLHMSCERRY